MSTIRTRAFGGAVQLLHLGERPNSAPNFCACVRAPHERLPRDAGRKAQVVLDPRAGARLSSKGSASSTRSRAPRTLRRRQSRVPLDRRRRSPRRKARCAASSPPARAQPPAPCFMGFPSTAPSVMTTMGSRPRRSGPRATRRPDPRRIDHPEGHPVASEEGGQLGHFRRPERPDEHRPPNRPRSWPPGGGSAHAECVPRARPPRRATPKLLGSHDDRLHLLDRLERRSRSASRERPEICQELARENFHLLRGASDQLRELREGQRSAERIAADGCQSGRPGSGTSPGWAFPPGRSSPGGTAHVAIAPDPLDLADERTGNIWSNRRASAPFGAGRCR